MILSFKIKSFGVFLLFSACLFWAFPGIAQDEPGTVESFAPVFSMERNAVDDKNNKKSYTLEAAAISSSTNLQAVVSETGYISLSVDALGIAENTEGNIQVEKPSGATVRGAYLASADVWGSNGSSLPNGAVILNGKDVNWDKHVKLNSSLGGPNHAWADVTSIIAPVVNAAPAGIVNITLKETILLDGSILAVIFDDPNQSVSNTVVLLFGAQQTTGDTFNIGLADPLDKSDPNLILDLSLGISFGYQTSSATYQHSNIDINTQRMTSCAGGQDDAITMSNGNGFLITAGGIGDSNTNPPDPYACPSGPDWDDELYNLLPYVNDGDTAIKIDTINPSNDDSIYFAALFLGSTTAVVGEGVILSPADTTKEINTSYSITATVQDDDGNPVVDRDVTFTVTSGPNAGLNETVTTNSEGKAVYAYTGTTVGTDSIVASFEDSQGNISTSNEAIVEWILPPNQYPEAQCKDVTLTLDSNGQTVLSPSQVDNASYDPDPEDQITLSLSRTNFSCSDIGTTHAVTLTVTDDGGLSDSCVSNVTVVDDLAPVPNAASLPQITGQCSATIPAAPTATDNCAGTATGTTGDPLSYSAQGTYTVNWTFDDGKGNTSTQTQQVVVQDTVAPTAVAKDITVQLDASGNASIVAGDIDNGSSDNCSIASMTVSPANFNCGNIGANTVTLTVTDSSGNVSTATATVTVQDTIAPTVVTKNITVQLDSEGNGSISVDTVDNGSTDNCCLGSKSISKSSFTCADVGENTVTLTVTDCNGNSSSATAIVTVVDNIAPVVLTQDVVVYLDDCNASITADDINAGSHDACGIASLSVDPASFTCSDIGENTVTLTVTDNNGNSSSATATVTIPNRPPNIDNAYPSTDCFSMPPDHRMEEISIEGVTDPDGQPVNLEITSITSDEPILSGGCADASIGENGTAELRVERYGRNGRVYMVNFTASDGQAQSDGSVKIVVPYGPLPRYTCEGVVDDGQNYDAADEASCPIVRPRTRLRR